MASGRIGVATGCARRRRARSRARGVLERRDAKVRSHGHTLRRLDDAQLHALRIQIKKLRYAADSFGALFDAAAVRGLEDNLSRLQDVLGEINDINVAQRQVVAALAGRRGRALREVRKLRAALAAWHDARTAALRRKLRSAWRGYRHAGKFW